MRRGGSSQTGNPSAETDLIVVGEITAPSGLKGDVRVRSFTRPVTEIFEYKRWVLDHYGPGGSGREKPVWQQDSTAQFVALVRGRRSGKNLVASLTGIATREQAEALAGLTICIDRAQLPEPVEGEYYWDDLVGLMVSNLEGVTLGKVDHLLETGANDVLVLVPTGEEGDESDQERLVPWIDDVIVSVDLEKRSLMVNWDHDF